MINPDSGEEVPNEEIQKGFEVEPGTFVILDEKELKSSNRKLLGKLKSVSLSRPLKSLPSITIGRTISDRTVTRRPTSPWLTH